jgi:hypothetical protein
MELISHTKFTRYWTNRDLDPYYVSMVVLFFDPREGWPIKRYVIVAGDVSLGSVRCRNAILFVIHHF